MKIINQKRDTVINLENCLYYEKYYYYSTGKFILYATFSSEKIAVATCDTEKRAKEIFDMVIEAEIRGDQILNLSEE